MASVVDICNLALGHLGDTANVSSIDPPEGSPQSEHCARFYPIARDSLLEMHTWGFATTRSNLALLSTDAWPEWKYCYASPTDALNIISILDPGAADDYSVGMQYGYSQVGVPVIMQGVYTPQPFAQETLTDGTVVIYTSQENAVCRYTRFISDPTVFSPLFVDTLAWYLASYLAGPILKGDAGAAEAKRCMGNAMGMLGKAAASDSNQRRIHPTQNVGWMAGR